MKEDDQGVGGFREAYSTLPDFPHPGPLPEGEGIKGLIFLASPIEERTGMLDEKYAFSG